MTEFTPLSALFGGALIGLSAVLYMALNGRIAGISGMAANLVTPSVWAENAATFAFLGGLVTAPFIYGLLAGGDIVQTVSDNLVLMAIAGFVVGVGSALGSGCTSGHGVCGIARISPRSLVATGTFMATGFITVYLVRHVFGG